MGVACSVSVTVTLDGELHHDASIFMWSFQSISRILVNYKNRAHTPNNKHPLSFGKASPYRKLFPSTNRSKPRGFLKFRCFCAFGNFSAGINRKTSTPVVSSALQREVANVSVASILGPLNPLLHPAITSLVRGVFSFALAIPT